MGNNGNVSVYTGTVVMTKDVAEWIMFDVSKRMEIKACLERHKRCDYGDACEEDVASNNRDNAERSGHVLSSYVVHGKKVWIETNFGDDSHPDKNYHTYTTIMFPSER